MGSFQCLNVEIKQELQDAITEEYGITQRTGIPYLAKTVWITCNELSGEFMNFTTAKGSHELFRFENQQALTKFYVQPVQLPLDKSKSNAQE